MPYFYKTQQRLDTPPDTLYTTLRENIDFVPGLEHIHTEIFTLADERVVWHVFAQQDYHFTVKFAPVGSGSYGTLLQIIVGLPVADDFEDKNPADYTSEQLTAVRFAERILEMCTISQKAVS